jgi:hypothetical protein
LGDLQEENTSATGTLEPPQNFLEDGGNPSETCVDKVLEARISYR